ncbi:nitronate monooxygenase [Modicisalibacter muralis]|uniref:Propionate 3-nitronate monooxygenase n=1 Tax=Modicisalibacter muralis TaxID=119000 RepID=A0A1G9IZD5_9GAMM|nr:nitronate monooxygenase [Halomonas muralis]SDL30386.1 nitronate monooxygenase [Halomonas muralis]
MRQTTASDEFCERFGLRYPIVQAPMAGVTTPELVAAVAGAGGLGSLGAAYLSPQALREQLLAVRGLTSAAFKVNLFLEHRPDPATLVPAHAALAATRAALSLSDELPTAPWQPDVHAQVDVLIEQRVPIVSFMFGVPEAALVSRLHDAGSVVWGNAMSVEDAERLVQAGCDAVVLQGVGAGGHRATFSPEDDGDGLDTLALVEAAAGRVKVPLIAAGGLMDGHDLNALLERGAVAGQFGTAFLDTDEAGTREPYRVALRGANELPWLTRAFSGRPARALPNRFTIEVEAQGWPLADFPIQNALTQPVRRVGAERDDAGLMALWSGVGVDRLRRMSAAAMVATLAEEARL